MTAGIRKPSRHYASDRRPPSTPDPPMPTGDTIDGSGPTRDDRDDWCSGRFGQVVHFAAGASFDSRLDENWACSRNLIPLAMKAACSSTALSRCSVTTTTPPTAPAYAITSPRGRRPPSRRPDADVRRARVCRTRHRMEGRSRPRHDRSDGERVPLPHVTAAVTAIPGRQRSAGRAQGPRPRHSMSWRSRRSRRQGRQQSCSTEG